jgi:hypothetical protein
VKSNTAREASSLLYEIEPILLPAVDGMPEVDTSRLRLIGESPHSGKALLSAGSDEERSALDEAREFLLAELDVGTWQPAEPIFKAARSIGIKDRTLQRARKDIGAESQKAGFGRGWEWRLPKAPSLRREPAFLHQGASPQVLAPSSENGLDEDAITELGLLSLGELQKRFQ